MPMLAHRIRKGGVRAARRSRSQSREYEYLFPVAAYGLVEGDLVTNCPPSCAQARSGGEQAVPAGVRAGDGHRRSTGPWPPC